MATALNFSRGTTAIYQLAFTRGGVALNLAGATLAAYILPGASSPIADAYKTLTVPTVTDAANGLAQLRFNAADTAALNMIPPPWWWVTATYGDGTVLDAGGTFQGPIFFAQLFGPEAEPFPTCDAVTAVLAPGGTINPLPNNMSNFAFTTQAALLAIPTVGLPVNIYCSGLINGAYTVVQTVAGNNPTGGGFFQPADNAASNRVWQQIN